MAERLQRVDAQILSPQYWEMHSPADVCEWTEKLPHLIEPFYDDSLRDFAEHTIINFLCQNQGEPKPISILKNGNTFDGTKLPEGTIIKYNREELKISRGDTRRWTKPHIKFDLWGIVCNRINYDSETEKVIVPFIDFVRFGELLPSPTEEPKLTVGKTRHKRTESKRGHISESLVKINSLEVYKIP